jgi:ABC-type molybdenum transport system ATPase subunit/photorepair protein PhrA
MFFNLVDVRPPQSARSQAFLIHDNWDDWFTFNTLYSLVYVDGKGERHTIGGVKIGQFKMRKKQRRPKLDDEFDVLDERFFSLGQDDSYYQNLNELGIPVRDRILTGLRDVAFDLNLFDRTLTEEVTGVSLLRSVTRSTVRGQFHRLAHGGARLSRYEFSYEGPGTSRSRFPPVSLSFEVEPDSQPPTNIHVLIGRNGVGKTHLLTLMTRALAEESSHEREVGRLVSQTNNNQDLTLFANLVSVSFSAFDTFEPLPVRRNKATGMHYVYIGLKRVGTTDEGRPLPPKSPSRLTREFVDSVDVCRTGDRADRWRRALQTLEADPIFKDSEVTRLVDADDEDEEQDLKTRASALFRNLSSGHKIVLLTITRLVEAVEERTLVLLDEPEAHLHPPLLSAFVRALSDLLMNRNGVAVIATHSPVVLQEVPRRCAWKIRRSGREVIVERPDIETFGENVGVLTREVFALEVTHSGFHQHLRDSIEAEGNFDDVVDRFDGEIGSEAKAIVRALIAARTSEDDD